MHSTMKLIARCLLIVLVFAIIGSSARPTTDAGDSGNHPRLLKRIHHHTRTSTKKRHAEVELTETMMQKMRELRMRALVNGLVNNLDNNAVKNIRYGNYYVPPHNGRPGYYYRSVKSFQVNPSADPYPTFNPNFAQNVDGLTVSEGLRARVVDVAPSRIPTTTDTYERYLRRRHDAITAKTAITCADMQKLVMQIGMRVHVKCSTKLGTQISSHSGYRYNHHGK